MKSLARTLVGLALMLGWWTLRGPGDDHTETASKIPSVVWDGGAGSMTIHTESTTPAQMRVSFSVHSKDSEEPDPRLLESYEDVPAGSHSWAIDVPKDVGGYVELSATSPQPGDRLHWTIEVGGNTVDEQSDTLEQPLEPGYGFFLQSYFDEYATGELGEG
jgi:hypothetical protein